MDSFEVLGWSQGQIPQGGNSTGHKGTWRSAPEHPPRLGSPGYSETLGAPEWKHAQLQRLEGGTWGCGSPASTCPSPTCIDPSPSDSQPSGLSRHTARVTVLWTSPIHSDTGRRRRERRGRGRRKVASKLPQAAWAGQVQAGWAAGVRVKAWPQMWAGPSTGAAAPAVPGTAPWPIPWRRLADTGAEGPPPCPPAALGPGRGEAEPGLLYTHPAHPHG